MRKHFLNFIHHLRKRLNLKTDDIPPVSRGATQDEVRGLLIDFLKRTVLAIEREVVAEEFDKTSTEIDPT